MLLLLGLFAAISLLASDLSSGMAWPLAAMAQLHGAWLARRESLKPSREIVIRDAGSRVEVDAVCVDDFRVDWRGVLAFARWHDGEGRAHRLVWWPDTLSPAARRELRLAAPVETSPRAPASMAP